MRFLRANRYFQATGLISKVGDSVLIFFPFVLVVVFRVWGHGGNQPVAGPPVKPYWQEPCTMPLSELTPPHRQPILFTPHQTDLFYIILNMFSHLALARFISPNTRRGKSYCYIIRRRSQFYTTIYYFCMSFSIISLLLKQIIFIHTLKDVSKKNSHSEEIIILWY